MASAHCANCGKQVEIENAHQLHPTCKECGSLLG